VVSSTGLSAIGTLITSVYTFLWSVVVADLTPQICVEPNNFAVWQRLRARFPCQSARLLMDKC
jgi:hypothetical protein